MNRRRIWLLWIVVVLCGIAGGLGLWMWWQLGFSDSVHSYDWVQPGMSIDEVIATEKTNGRFEDVGAGRGEAGGFVYRVYVTDGWLVVDCDSESKVQTWDFQPYPRPSLWARFRRTLR